MEVISTYGYTDCTYAELKTMDRQIIFNQVIIIYKIGWPLIQLHLKPPNTFYKYLKNT